jgi:hypothetical protein
VKFSLDLIKYRAMKVYGGSGGIAPPYLSSILEGRVSSRCRKTAPGTHCVGSRSELGFLGRTVRRLVAVWKQEVLGRTCRSPVTYRRTLLLQSSARILLTAYFLLVSCFALVFGCENVDSTVLRNVSSLLPDSAALHSRV